jgi:hypothetical protein
MNVAIEPTSAAAPASAAREDPSRRDPNVEWIDPEGDDWFARVYLELVGEPHQARPGSRPAPKLEFWFGQLVHLRQAWRSRDELLVH